MTEFSSRFNNNAAFLKTILTRNSEPGLVCHDRKPICAYLHSGHFALTDSEEAAPPSLTLVGPLG